MAPSPSYLPTAFPKSVNSRATHDDGGVVATALSTTQLPTTIYPLPSTSLNFYTAKAISHDGEGAPLLRPHARLTSFGGYVATYGRSQQVRPSRVGQRSQRTATLPWRWRPRHRICQPPSRNQSIPAQRTTARAPSLRQIPKCNRKSKIINLKFFASASREI